MNDESDLQAARRWVGHSLHGYPAVSDAEETAATLAAAPPERAKKKSKPASELAA
jgi:hypothetical protein